MKTILLSCLLFMAVMSLHARQHSETDLENLLHEFLAGASVNDAAIHDRFWADDLTYTSAAGERFGKDEIMNGLAVGAPDGEAAPLPVYSAGELQIEVYGDMAVVAFRLIAEVPLESGGHETIHFYNTGTFLNRDAEWRAVAWQATRIPD